jgi:hypothetical protein
MQAAIRQSNPVLLVNDLSAAGVYFEVVRTWNFIGLGPYGLTSGAADEMIVNLNQYRKKRRRAEAEAKATENRIRFGRSKEERSRESRERERSEKEIENKRLD